MSQSSTSDISDVQTERSDGSGLCLECGLCCRGVLHKRADLEPVERGRAETLGLQIAGGGASEQLAFELPCAAFDKRRNECSIYDDRFAVCQRYRCHLLRRLDAGSIALADGLATVARARELLARIQAAGDGGSDAEAMLDVAELRLLVEREFLPRD